MLEVTLAPQGERTVTRHSGRPYTAPPITACVYEICSFDGRPLTWYFVKDVRHPPEGKRHAVVNTGYLSGRTVSRTEVVTLVGAYDPDLLRRIERAAANTVVQLY